MRPLHHFVQGAVRFVKKSNFTIDDRIPARALLELCAENAGALRRGLLRTTLGGRPTLAFLGRHVQFFNFSAIRFGRGVRLGDYVYVSALGTGGVTFGNNASVGAFSRIIVSTTFNDPGSHIRIGDDVGIGEFASIGGAGGVDIGDGTIVGAYLSLHPENHVTADLSIPIRMQGVTRRGIRIGSDCWLGAKVTVLDGVTIGDGCIVGAGAVVTRSFPDRSVIAGVPARLIRIRAQR